MLFRSDAAGSLTRHPQTHARTIYFGLRHYYREISRYWHARYPQGLPASAQAQKQAMLPPTMFGPGTSSDQAGPGIVLCGDLGNPAVIARVRDYLVRNDLGRDNLGQKPDHHYGISHIPDPACYKLTPTQAARFCDGFFLLLQEGRVQIVLPYSESDIGSNPAIRINLNAPGTPV